MTWEIPTRPDWVAAVNRGDIWPMSDAAAVPFSLDRLAGDAASRLGIRSAEVVDRLGDDVLEALSVLLPALEDEARLTVLGRWITHRFLGRLVEQRLALDRYVESDPGVLDEQIVEPWFVIGAPRTGTTILYGLLGQDDGLRAPQGWELLRPTPPPARSDDIDARLALADVELRTPQVVASGLASIHSYSGRMPKECLSAMSLALRSEEFVSRYDVPSYERWLHTTDMRPAYEMHRRVLQVLQRGAPKRRWLLKCPVHLQNLPTLLEVYPDARCSGTHRDPLSILPSVSSLIATLRSAHSDEVDAAAIGRYHVDLYATSLDRYVDHVDGRLIAPERLTDSRHVDFLVDAMSVVRGLYDHLGFELGDETAARMQTYLRDREEERGGHSYDLATFGIDADEVHRRFARYTGRFGVGPVDPVGHGAAS